MKIGLLFLALCFTLNILSFGDDKKTADDKLDSSDTIFSQDRISGDIYHSDNAGADVWEVTKEDIISDLRERLTFWGDEVVDLIPEIVAEGEGEEVVYRVKLPSGNIVDFENLNFELLETIHTKVINQISIININRVNEQLRIIQQINMLQRQQQAIPKTPARPPVIPNQPPRIHHPRPDRR